MNAPEEEVEVEALVHYTSEVVIGPDTEARCGSPYWTRITMSEASTTCSKCKDGLSVRVSFMSWREWAITAGLAGLVSGLILLLVLP